MPEATEHRLIDEILSRLPSLAGKGDLVKRITATLTEEIISGSLPADSQLTSVELGKRFQTSRTPIREALFVLQQEGLVDIEARKRPHVSTLDNKDIRDLYSIRANLYSLVAEQIVRDASIDDVNLLLPSLQGMQDALSSHDVGSFFVASVQFRNVEASICQNHWVGTMIESLGLRVYRLRRFGLSLPGRLNEAWQDHYHLYQAYVERDEDLARAIAKSLVWRALRAIEANIGSPDVTVGKYH